MSSYTTDLSKYDRQLRTFGIEATQKINESVVNLIGLEGGLGTEVAKNLVLSGIKQLNLYDTNLVSKRDIEFGYFYDESMLNKKRTECLIPFL